MKHLLTLVAIGLGLSAAAQPLTNSLLWKISGNGLQAPSYLFGTIHMSCDATLTDKVKKALDDTQQLYLELDMDDPSIQAGMMQGMLMKDNVKMTDLASAEDIKLLDTYFRENAGMGIESLTMVKPVFLSMMLLPKLLDCPMKSLEQELMKAGAAQSEPVFGLEDVQDQIAALEAVPVQEQMDELIKSAKDNMKHDREELRSMIAVYNSENIELLLSLTQQSENVISSKYDNDLLAKRNKNWVPKIGTIAKEKPTFFAVGAAHLAGEEGVIRLLRKNGFSVEAVGK